MLKRILLLISIFSTSLFSQTPQGTYKIWADSLRVDSSGTFIDVTERLHTTYGKYLHSSAKDTIRTIVIDSTQGDDDTIERSGGTLRVKPLGIGKNEITLSDIIYTGQGLSASQPNGLYVSNGGITWSRLASAVMDSIRAVNTIQIYSASDLLIKDSTFVGTWGRAYVSNTVNAQDSMYFNVPVPYYMKNDVVVFYSYKVTFVGTGLCGVVAINLYKAGSNGALTVYDKDETGWSVDDEAVTVEIFVNSAMPTNPLILEVVIFPDTELKITNIEFAWR